MKFSRDAVREVNYIEPRGGTRELHERAKRERRLNTYVGRAPRPYPFPLFCTVRRSPACVAYRLVFLRNGPFPEERRQALVERFRDGVRVWNTYRRGGDERVGERT